jgi:hypothetical protein
MAVREYRSKYPRLIEPEARRKGSRLRQDMLGISILQIYLIFISMSPDQSQNVLRIKLP